jgi:SAM-dependent MidA family methyltransferase
LDPGHEPALIEVIRAEIRSAGPMTFARFMELALYHPELGYYATGSRGPGRASDFLTAPESHPIFGWTIARQLEEVWERLGSPPRFVVREHGAGSGALAAGIVEGLVRSGSQLLGVLRYRIAERAPDRERQLRERLEALGAADVLEPDDGGPIEGAVLGNEVLDALPVHRVTASEDGALRELHVALDEQGILTTVEAEPSTPALGARLDSEGISLLPGQHAEVCLALDPWIAAAASGLARGLVLLIDYGHPAPALYDPARGSLLRAYLHHRVHGDPYRNVGRQDLTAHVDLTAVEHAMATAGLEHLGTTTQAEFLTGLGIGDLLVGLQDDPGAQLEGYLLARSALMRLLDPRATGRFSVLAYGRNLDALPPLRGLAFRLARRA